MTHNTDNLHVIGAALAAAGDREPVELTDQQREVLARATVPDTLDAILAHVTIPPPDDSSADKIATAWSDELRVAFRLQSIADAITEDDSIETIRRVVSRDNRLSAEESRFITGLLSHNHGRPLSDSRSTSTKVSTLPRPRAYLASISVEGFRGIGPRADLPLKPQRGITLVYGANGSGKSTFVEALEVLLTGGTARFAGRGREWRSAWANAHRPDRGQIAAEFVVEDRDARRDTVQRDWTAADLAAAASEKDDSLWGAVQTIGGFDVAEAIDRFRPVLGYGELGPLFEESVPLEDTGSNVTQFAQHIRTRANIRDNLADALWAFISSRPSHNRHRVYSGLSAWFLIAALSSAAIANSPSVRMSSDGAQRISAAVGDLTTDATLRSPVDWNWMMLTTDHKNTTSHLDSFVRKQALDVASAYWPQLTGQIQSIVRQYTVDYFRRDGLLADLDADARHSHSLTDRFFSTYAPRVGVYAEMLLNEVHRARLERFSKRVSNFWQKIRRSSDVQFEVLSLEAQRRISDDEHSRPGHGFSSALHLRVSLGLTIDGDRAIERGALSQGELHSLALSVFLPTLMNPESP